MCCCVGTLVTDELAFIDFFRPSGVVLDEGGHAH